MKILAGSDCIMKSIKILNGEIWASFAAPDSKMILFRKCQLQNFNK